MARRNWIAGALIGLAVSSIASSQEAWSQFHHDAGHTGATSEDGPTTNHVKWTFDAGGSEQPSPIVDWGMVYIGGANGTIYALDATGSHSGQTTVEWSRSLSVPFRSSLAMIDGILYATGSTTGTYGGQLFALHAGTGDLMWNRGPFGGIGRKAPAAGGGYVYFADDSSGSDDQIYCYDSAGNLVWTHPLDSAGLPNEYGPTGPALANDKIYFGALDTTVRALDRSFGTRLWEFPGATGAVYGTPAVTDSAVYFGSADHKLYKLNENNGALVWTYATAGEIHGTPAVHNGIVYVGSDDHHLHAVSDASGVGLWTYDAGGDIHSSPVITANDLICFGVRDSAGADLICLDTAGDLVWSYSGNGSIISSPAVVGGMLYVADPGREVIAFAPPPSAHCQWYCGSGVNASTDGFVVTSPPIINDTFSATVTGCAPGNTISMLFGYVSALTFSTSWGELLVNFIDPSGELLGMPVAVGNPATFNIPVPNFPALAGLTTFIQAASMGGSVCLHCAFECRVDY